MNLTEKYRRNGKLQSCESCRKSKLRCDHVVPACGRCVKRGKAGQCFYHPNPLTQNRRPTTPANSLPTPSSAASRASPHKVRQSVEQFQDTPEPTETSSIGLGQPGALELKSLAPASSHAQCQPFHRAASAPPLDYQGAPGVRKNNGFQGPTSHENILREGLGILEPVFDELGALSQQETIVITNERITQGIKVLLFFIHNKNMMDRSIAKWDERCAGSVGLVIKPIMKEWISKLWLFHGNALESHNPVKMRKLSELIWRNTLTPLEFSGDITAREWACLGTGPGLRWETLGLVALNIGFCLLETPATDQVFIEHKFTRSCVLSQVIQVADQCLAFCRHCEVLDDLFIWLLSEHSQLVVAMKGDRDYGSYRVTGELNSAVVAMGLHQAIKANDKIPFFLAELRKRTFMAAYYSEVSLSTLLGRPPRLSYRYCTLDPPLDLTEEQIVQTGAELAATLASLDGAGYNTQGKLQSATLSRTYGNLAMRREDVVDLALGHYSRDEVISRARTIQEESDRHLASLPGFIKRLLSEPFELSDQSQLNAPACVRLCALRNLTRANEMLLQRVLIRKTGASSEKLILTARQVFRDMLQITQRYDIAAQYQATYNCFLCGNGLRSAAILAIELLKQETLPWYPENPYLPRSQTIQDLAVFGARLGSVAQGDGSYNLCQQGKRVIGKILDRILTPPGAREECTYDLSQTPPTTGAESGGQAQGVMPGQVDVDASTMNTVGPVLNGMGMSLPAVPGNGTVDVYGIGVEAPMSLSQDIDFMKWLEGMNWERMDNWSV